MYTQWFVVYLERVMVIALLFISSSGCSTQTEHINVPTVTSSSQLSAFILGEWLSTEVKSNKSEMINLQYKIVFETESQVKFIVIYPESGTEGYTLTYSFIDQNSIFVDNKRITGGETWLLEKKDDNLIVTRNFDNKTTIIVLERIR
ncbi:MAG: hypothetical protein L0287_33175 [Anaerolineae bacterium]|nr:hypothetical protein [Anaerolineae bacterium]